MKNLLVFLILLPSLALAQRGGPNRPPVNAALSCSVAVPTGTSCSGYEQQWCVTDQSSTEGKAWRCSPTYHTWVKFGEIDTAGSVTTAAFADSLSANGANCNSGSAPLGVSATGAAEGCFAVQPLDSDLTGVAALNFCVAGQIPKSSGGTSWACSADSTGGSPTFDTVANGTNTGNLSLLVGNGSAFGPTGTGTVTANLLTCSSACVSAAEIAALSSAELRTILSDESGTGVALFGTAPTMSDPVVGTQLANDASTKAASTAYVQTELTAYAADTVTFTNKTLDAESTGNSMVIPTKAWLPAAGCQASTATSFWDNLTANPAAAACVTGSVRQEGVLDFDPTTNEFAQYTIMLPDDWVGTTTAKFVWFSSLADATKNVIWGIQTRCIADGEADDQTFDTVATVTDANKGTANLINTASVNMTTSTCSVGEMMHINVYRDAASSSDTMTANDARLLGVELTMRRSM